MFLKRIAKEGSPGVTSHVRVIHTGTGVDQKFSTGLVYQALAEGWVSISGDRLTLKAEPEDLKYRIKREPGWYCCHDGARIPISAAAQREFFETGVGRLSASEARAYLEAKGFAGKASPDPRHPSGYEVVNAYECELDADQHAKFAAEPGGFATIGRIHEGA